LSWGYSTAVPVLGSKTALAVQKAWAGREKWVRGGCELGKFRWAMRAMRRRPGLEVPGDGAELAPLEVMQAGVRV